MESDSEAVFIQGDATYTNQYVKDRFDLISSSTTSHYIEHLETFFEHLKQSLNDEGTIILSIIHPVYSAIYPIEHGDTFPEDEEWQVRYLDKSRRAYIQPWIEYNDNYENHLSKSYHHLFGDYINAIIKAGLKIERIEEPLPPASWKSECEGRYEGYMETPVYMLLKLIK